MPGTPPRGCLRMESLDCGPQQSQGWAHTCIGGLSMELQMLKLHPLSFAFKSIWELLASFASLSSALDGLRFISSVCDFLRIATSLRFLGLLFVKVSPTLRPIPLLGRQLLPLHAWTACLVALPACLVMLLLTHWWLQERRNFLFGASVIDMMCIRASADVAGYSPALTALFQIASDSLVETRASAISFLEPASLT